MSHSARGDTFVIADEQPLFRDGLKLLVSEIRPESRVVETGTLEATLKTLEANPGVELLFLGAGLPGSESYGGLSEVLSRFPEQRVMILTSTHDDGRILRALSLGAKGYILRSAKREVMRLAISLVLAGDTYVPFDEVFHHLGRYEGEPEGREEEQDGEQQELEARDGTLLASLTERQLDVLACLINGHSNKVIARKLDVDEATVKSHLHSIMRKLKVNNRTQAALHAVRLGFHPGQRTADRGGA